jgi:hypothetical protein
MSRPLQDTTWRSFASRFGKLPIEKHLARLIACSAWAKPVLESVFACSRSRRAHVAGRGLHRQLDEVARPHDAARAEG